MDFLILSFIVFSITLLITKSKILAAKREFVQKRYESSKINGSPSFIHRIWHAIWHCPMCSGFWVALIVYIFCHQFVFFDVIIAFGLNWILHCVENVLFQFGKILEDFFDNAKI